MEPAWGAIATMEPAWGGATYKAHMEVRENTKLFSPQSDVANCASVGYAATRSSLYTETAAAGIAIMAGIKFCFALLPLLSLLPVGRAEENSFERMDSHANGQSENRNNGQAKIYGYNRPTH